MPLSAFAINNIGFFENITLLNTWRNRSFPDLMAVVLVFFFFFFFFFFFGGGGGACYLVLVCGSVWYDRVLFFCFFLYVLSPHNNILSEKEF